MNPETLSDVLVESMIARASHLEQILVTTLLGLLLTTTFGLFVAVYTLKKEGDSISSFMSIRMFLVGIALLYVTLSGFYYYMLAHFYAAVQSAFALIKPDDLQDAVAPIWSLFRLPEMLGLSQKARAIGYLAIAPLFPVSFSCTAITVLWWSLRREMAGQRKSSIAIWLSSLAVQILMAYLLISHPFSAFTSAIEHYIDRQEGARIQAQP